MKNAGLLAFFVLAMCGIAQADETATQEAGDQACAKVALKVVSDVWDSDNPPFAEILRRCERDAVPATCRAANDMISDNGKKTPLHCPPPR